MFYKTFINKALRVYEKVRKRHAVMLMDLVAASGKAMHLDEGDAKKAR